jgi:hypothetical protein
MAEISQVPLSAIYEPAIWNKYFLQFTTEKSEFMRAGIMAAAPEVIAAANEGGRTVTMPFWQDLAHNTAPSTNVSSLASNTDDNITPMGITTGEDKAVKDFRTAAWETGGVIKYIVGSDPAEQYLNRLAYWWTREEQRILLSKLKGVMANSVLNPLLSNDISQAAGLSATDANKINSGAIEDTRFLLGDAYAKFTAMVMHSTCLKTLRKMNLIDFIPDSAQVDTLLGTKPQGQAPGRYYYGDLEVFTDDTVTVVAGGTNGYCYHTFLFGTGAIARVDVPLTGGDMNLEYWIDPRANNGAGTKEIVTRRFFIMHPRGIAYTGSVGSGATYISPSDSQLETGTNWTQAFLTKNLRIARLITNG